MHLQGYWRAGRENANLREPASSHANCPNRIRRPIGRQSHHASPDVPCPTCSVPGLPRFRCTSRSIPEGGCVKRPEYLSWLTSIHLKSCEEGQKVTRNRLAVNYAWPYFKRRFLDETRIKIDIIKIIM